MRLAHFSFMCGAEAQASKKTFILNRLYKFRDVKLVSIQKRDGFRKVKEDEDFNHPVRSARLTADKSSGLSRQFHGDLPQYHLPELRGRRGRHEYIQGFRGL